MNDVLDLSNYEVFVGGDAIELDGNKLYVPMSATADQVKQFLLAQKNDFPLGQACDLSGEGTCEACQ